MQVRSVDDLRQVHADAALDVCGSDRTRWNGSWQVSRRDGVLATRDGGLRIGAEQQDTLDEMFARSGQRSDLATRARYRGVIQDLLRENARMFSLDATDSIAGTPLDDRPWAAVIDRGCPEAFSHEFVDDYIDHLGLAAVVPGIRDKDVQAGLSFPREVAAARGLIAEFNGPERFDRHSYRMFAMRSPEQRTAFLRSGIESGGNVKLLVPREDRDALPEVMTTALDRLADVQAGELATAEEAGRAAVRGMRTKAGELVEQHANPGLTKLVDEAQVEAALEVSGADHSSFNGMIGTVADAHAGTIYGTSTFDGHMLLNNERVLQPLRELYADPTAARTPDDLMRMRAALRTLFHENIHMLAEHGASIADDQRQLRHPWTVAVEEGFTNAFTERRLDDFVRGLDLPKDVTDGLIAIQQDPEFSAKYPSSYPRYTPAAQAVADGLATEQRGSDDTLRQLANRTMASTLHVATDMLYESSDLPRLVPDHDTFHVKRSIERVLTHNFSWLEENTGRGDADQVRELSAQRGAQAVGAARWQIAQFEQQYRSPDGGGFYHAAMVANRGVASPTGSAITGRPPSTSPAGATTTQRGRPPAVQADQRTPT